MYYAEDNGNPLCFRSDSQLKGIPKVYYINNLKSILGSELCVQLLFLHEFIVCDSTSYIFDVGKKKVFQKKIKGDRAHNSYVTDPSLYQAGNPLI